MAQWKKIIVSGSDAELNSIVITTGNQQISSSVAHTFLSGSFSGSFFGSGAGLTGVSADSIAFSNITGLPTLVSSSAQIDHDQTTNFDANEHFTQANITTVGTVTAGSVTAILPAGTVSGSIQVDHNSTTNYSAAEHVDHSTVDITAGPGLLGGGDISATRTLSVNSGSMLPYYSGSIFNTVSGDITISAAGVAAIANDAVALGTNTTGNYVATITGTANEIEVSGGTGEGSTPTIGLPNNVTIAGTLTAATASIQDDLTVGGNLIVNGDLTYLAVANLAVDDQYILLASGSTNTDSGIIFGGSEGTLNSGNALFWNYDYNSNDGRLAVASAVSSTTTAALTPSYSIAGVFEGTEGDAATAQADHPGNIRIENGEIYIYV